MAPDDGRSSHHSLMGIAFTLALHLWQLLPACQISSLMYSVAGLLTATSSIFVLRKAYYIQLHLRWRLLPTGCASLGFCVFGLRDAVPCTHLWLLHLSIICFAILHIPHIMQNKIRQGDTKKAVLINMCLPMINNKLLEICKGEPNNLEQQY